ncbi:GumC family protein [Desulfosoma sp.]
MEPYRFSIVRELAHVVFTRRRVVALVFMGVFSLFVALAIFLPPQYRSAAKFAIFVPQSLDPLRRETFYDYQARAERILQDQKELIYSHRVMNRVVEKLYPTLNEMERAAAIARLVRNLEVTPPGGATYKESNTFYVAYTDSDAVRARDIAQLICEAYLETFSELAKESAGFSFSFYKEQTQRLYDEMLQKEKEMRGYEVENANKLIAILNMQTTPGTNLEVGPNALLTQFQAKYYDLQQQLAGIQMGLSALEREAAKDAAPVIPGELQVAGHAITAFKNKVAQLEIQLNELRAQFTGQFPAVRSVQRELQMNVASLRRELERTIKAQRVTAESLSGQIQELERVMRLLQTEIKEIAAARATYEQLKQQFDLAKQAYEKARDQMQQAELAVALDQSKQSLSYVQPPSVPDKPFKPNRPLLLAMGLAGGIIVAIAVAATVDYFDHTVRRPEDVEKNIGIPVLESIPRV